MCALKHQLYLAVCCLFWSCWLSGYNILCTIRTGWWTNIRAFSLPFLEVFQTRISICLPKFAYTSLCACESWMQASQLSSEILWWLERCKYPQAFRSTKLGITKLSKASIILNASYVVASAFTCSSEHGFSLYPASVTYSDKYIGLCVKLRVTCLLQFTRLTWILYWPIMSLSTSLLAQSCKSSPC